MRHQLNLATNPYINYRPFIVTVVGLGLVALGLTLWVAVEGFTAWRRGTEAQERRFNLETRRSELAAEQAQLEQELRAPETMAVLERAQFFNQLISQKRLSWAQLFVDLQKALPPDVRVLSLAPRLREDGRLEVSMRVGAASDGAVIKLLESLGQSGKFPEVKLETQSSEGTARADAVAAQLAVVYQPE